MIQENRDQLVAELKRQVQDHPSITQMDDLQIKELTKKYLADRIAREREANSELYTELISMNFQDRAFIVNSVFESIRGLGVLGQIINDPDITEVMINGYDNIFVERRHRLTKLNERFESAKELEIIINKFVSQAGRQVTESDPIVDTRLADGSRVNVVLPPIALNGPIVTIRRFPKEAFTMKHLIELGSLPEDVAQVLKTLIECRYNIFISGGTGSGKTTFLNVLSNFIPKDERIITIEDSAELQIKGIDNLVRLETRNAGPDGSGAVTIQHLIKSALRMRPDRIIVGEVRGGEALDMLQAMNTGHDGSLSTGHANSAEDMLSRLETMVLQGTKDMPLEAIRQQIASAVDIIVHLSRMRDKTRKTVEISEVVGYDYENRRIIMRPLYRFVESPESTAEKVVGRLVRTEHPMVHTDKLEKAHAKIKI